MQGDITDVTELRPLLVADGIRDYGIQVDPQDERVSYLVLHLVHHVGRRQEITESAGRVRGRRALGYTWMCITTIGEAGYGRTAWSAGAGNPPLAVCLVAAGGLSFIAIKAVGVTGNVRTLMPVRTQEEADAQPSCGCRGVFDGIGSVTMGALAQVPSGLLVYVGTGWPWTVPVMVVCETPLTTHAAQIFIDGIREARQRRDPRLRRGFECRDRILGALRAKMRSIPELSSVQRATLLRRIHDLDPDDKQQALGQLMQAMLVAELDDEPEGLARRVGRYVATGLAGASGVAKLALVTGLSYKVTYQASGTALGSVAATLAPVACWGTLSYKYILGTGANAYDSVCDWWAGRRSLSDVVCPRASWGMLAGKLGLSGMAWGATSVAVTFVYGTSAFAMSQQVICGAGAGLLALAGLNFVANAIVRQAGRHSRDQGVRDAVALEDLFLEAIALIERASPEEAEKLYDALTPAIRAALGDEPEA